MSYYNQQYDNNDYPPQLYQDYPSTNSQQNTDYGYNPTQFFNPQVYAAQQMMSDPAVANAAFNYGSNMAKQGVTLVNQKVESYFAISKLNYYFAVDNTYVGKKLLILLFPFINKKWQVEYDPENAAVQPKVDVNAPDYYIPLMSFVTFIITAGIALGNKSKFVPDQLGIICSSCLVWFLLELFVIILSIYLINLDGNIRRADFLAYSGYKFFYMNVLIIVGLLFGKVFYLVSLAWFSFVLGYFLIKTLRLQLLAVQRGMDMVNGTKRKTYVLLLIVAFQPLVMWWQTASALY